MRGAMLKEADACKGANIARIAQIAQNKGAKKRNVALLDASL
ncbi:hypothetical protein ACEN2S_18515 [Phaeovulum sp. W22_SRMD_FR3]